MSEVTVSKEGIPESDYRKILDDSLRVFLKMPYGLPLQTLPKPIFSSEH
jgi:hypothetical protein